MPNPNNAVVIPFLATLLVDTSANWTKSYAAVGGIIVMLDPPKMKRGVSKTSGLGNVNHAHTKKPNWIDSGQMKFAIKFKASDFALLYGYFTGDADARYFKLRYNDGSSPTSGSTEEMLAFIVGMGDKQFDSDTEDPIETEVTLEISDIIAFGQAS
jgi:hypothetical protein